MQRREFIAGAAGARAWPRAAWPQQRTGADHRLARLGTTTPPREFVEGFAGVWRSSAFR
jgi:hypothetical protein